MHRSRLPILISGALLTVSFVAGTPAAEASGAHTTATSSVEQLRVPDGATYSNLTYLSCAAIGYCAAGGYAWPNARSHRAMISTEVHGDWGPLQNVGPNVPAGSDSAIYGVACPAPGSCLAVGSASSPSSASNGGYSSNFMISQPGSGWSSSRPIPFSGAGPHPNFNVNDLQCPTKNYCVITGFVTLSKDSDSVYAETWQSGTWGAPHIFSSDIGGHAGSVAHPTLSCPSASWCIEVGGYLPVSGRYRPVTATMSKGRWGRLKSLKGYHNSTNYNSLASISCVAAGECVATGASQRNGVSSVPLIMTESFGRWAKPRTLAIPGVTSPLYQPTQMLLVSCARESQCTGLITLGDIDGFTIGAATLRGAGHWSVDRTTDLGRFRSPTLLALSCLKSICVAVGTGYGPGPIQVRYSVPLVVTAVGKW
jgi:hypothetical protein